jgi:hypothetical protein
MAFEVLTTWIPHPSQLSQNGPCLFLIWDTKRRGKCIIEQ